MKLRWTRTARADLDELRAFIEEENPAAAAEVAARILAAVTRLVDHPAIGRPGRIAATRELVITGTPFVVPYRVRGRTVELLRVLHGARRWPKRI